MVAKTFVEMAGKYSPRNLETTVKGDSQKERCQNLRNWKQNFTIFSQSEKEGHNNQKQSIYRQNLKQKISDLNVSRGVVPKIASVFSSFGSTALVDVMAYPVYVWHKFVIFLSFGSLHGIF